MNHTIKMIVNQNQKNQIKKQLQKTLKQILKKKIALNSLINNLNNVQMPLKVTKVKVRYHKKVIVNNQLKNLMMLVEIID